MKLGIRVSFYDSKLLWPRLEEWFRACSLFFCAAFAGELLLKIVGLGYEFVYSMWNWLDVLLVLSSLLDILEVTERTANAAALRVARLSRLLRVMKVLRKLGTFDSLYIMTTAMRGSIPVLFWSVSLLALANTVLALILQVLCTPFIEEAAEPGSNQTAAGQKVFGYSGTFSRSVLTMFETALGNFIVPCRIMMHNVHPGFIFFFLCTKLVIGFSIVSVITGVFTQETFKAAAQDDLIMIRHKQRAKRVHEAKMKTLFKHADKNRDGYLDAEEFQEVLADPSLQMWLAAQEVHVDNAERLFFSSPVKAAKFRWTGSSLAWAS